uniref:Uncharacterized protein n=1 Tax=Clytia hemisphaerica TaxID=252671 RepID=A0A7M5XKI2_9CNID
SGKFYMHCISTPVLNKDKKLNPRSGKFYMHCISTPVLNKDKKLNPRSGISTKHSLRMATPAFSPAPSTFASSKKERLPTSKQMPSTAELYRFMSLNYDGSVSRNIDR